MTIHAGVPEFLEELNFLHDRLIPLTGKLALKPSALRVALVILRQMMLNKTQYIELSFTELGKLTGLSREAVSDGLKFGIERGFIVRTGDASLYAYSFQVVGEVDCLPEEATEGAEEGKQAFGDADWSDNTTSRRIRPKVVGESDRKWSENSTSLPLFNLNNSKITKNSANARASPAFIHEYAGKNDRNLRDRTWHKLLEIYPHRNKHLSDAKLVFFQLNLTPAFADHILSAVEKQKKSRDWRNGYIPRLDNWLRDCGWNYEVEPASAGGKASVKEHNAAVAERLIEKALKGEKGEMEIVMDYVEAAKGGER